MLSHGSAPPEPGWLPDEVVSAVLLAVDYNLADVRVLTQACLALGNVGSAGVQHIPVLILGSLTFCSHLVAFKSSVAVFHLPPLWLHSPPSSCLPPIVPPPFMHTLCQDRSYPVQKSDV